MHPLKMSHNPQLPIITSDSGFEAEGSTQVVSQSKSKTKKPAQFKVVLLNDDFTPMNFVVHILQKFFKKSRSEANRIMMQVHKSGAGVAGVYSHEIAETKVFLVNQYAQKNKHPLKSIMEKA